MTPDQRLKLAQALVTEAAVTPDTEEARHLSELAVKHAFKEEIEKLIKGDVELFKITFKAMSSQNVKARIVSRILITMLMKNADFQKTFRDKFLYSCFDLLVFENEQKDDYEVPPFDDPLW
tara:strand:+ start:2740 stop:3102 length:363 start_codon:yes stop_codon:yes gene_type:complete